MKYFSFSNFRKYRDDLASNLPEEKGWNEYTRDELIVKFMPLVEHIAKSFPTTETSSGVMNLEDLIQEGAIGLIKAVDRFDIEFAESKDRPETSIKSFFSKRIKGAIRRGIDSNRAGMRIPEYKMSEIRKSNGEDRELVKIFFTSVFKSIDDHDDNQGSKYYNIPDRNTEYNVEMLNAVILSLMKSVLDKDEYEVVRMSYGLDCDKVPARAIARKLNITGSSCHVRVSYIKKRAISKLIEQVDISQVSAFIN
jgi:RNA polymerase sigma factor (sigma-70 family)